MSCAVRRCPATSRAARSHLSDSCLIPRCPPISVGLRRRRRVSHTRHALKIIERRHHFGNSRPLTREAHVRRERVDALRGATIEIITGGGEGQSRQILGNKATELRLDEAVLRESSKIKRLMWPVKTVSVIAPLLE